MTLNDFLRELENGIMQLDESERNSRLGYSAEMIQDRVEDGMSEAEAVASMGDPAELARTILAEQPLPALVKQRIQKEKKKQRSGSAVTTVLAIVGFPFWFPLLLAFAAIILAVDIVLLALVVVLFAVVLALGVSALAALVAGVYMIFKDPPLAIAGFGAALILAGLTVLVFIGAKAAAKGIIKLIGLMWRGLKRLIIGKKDKNNEKVS